MTHSLTRARKVVVVFATRVGCVHLEQLIGSAAAQVCFDTPFPEYERRFKILTNYKPSQVTNPQTGHMSSMPEHLKTEHVKTALC